VPAKGRTATFGYSLVCVKANRQECLSYRSEPAASLVLFSLLPNTLAERPGEQAMTPRKFFLFAAVPTVSLALSPAWAQDRVAVTSCPGQPKMPVSFTADCSHVMDAETRGLCRAFIENQACKVFPAYRKITGIHLEEKCPSIQYNIYERENWPGPKKGEGGLAGRCEIMLMTEHSLKVRSKIGPYDLHELLHEYQWVVGPFPQEHAFFASTQAEAAKEIEDPIGRTDFEAKLKHEVGETKSQLADLKALGDKACVTAETYIENTLYLEDASNIYAFYRKLGPVPARKTHPELEARVNRMLTEVSNGKARPFLIQHGCAPF
jgi:hypothetical protein